MGDIWRPGDSISAKKLNRSSIAVQPQDWSGNGDFAKEGGRISTVMPDPNGVEAFFVTLDEEALYQAKDVPGRDIFKYSWTQVIFDKDAGYWRRVPGRSGHHSVDSVMSRNPTQYIDPFVRDAGTWDPEWKGEYIGSIYSVVREPYSGQLLFFLSNKLFQQPPCESIVENSYWGEKYVSDGGVGLIAVDEWMTRETKFGSSGGFVSFIPVNLGARSGFGNGGYSQNMFLEYDNYAKRYRVLDFSAGLSYFATYNAFGGASGSTIYFGGTATKPGGALPPVWHDEVKRPTGFVIFFRNKLIWRIFRLTNTGIVEAVWGKYDPDDVVTVHYYGDEYFPEANDKGTIEPEDGKIPIIITLTTAPATLIQDRPVTYKATFTRKVKPEKVLIYQGSSQCYSQRGEYENQTTYEPPLDIRMVDTCSTCNPVPMAGTYRPEKLYFTFHSGGGPLPVITGNKRLQAFWRLLVPGSGMGDEYSTKEPNDQITIFVAKNLRREVPLHPSEANHTGPPSPSVTYEDCFTWEGTDGKPVYENPVVYRFYSHIEPTERVEPPPVPAVNPVPLPKYYISEFTGYFEFPEGPDNADGTKNPGMIVKVMKGPAPNYSEPIELRTETIRLESNGTLGGYSYPVTPNLFLVAQPIEDHPEINVSAARYPYTMQTHRTRGVPYPVHGVLKATWTSNASAGSEPGYIELGATAISSARKCYIAPVPISGETKDEYFYITRNGSTYQVGIEKDHWYKSADYTDLASGTGGWLGAYYNRTESDAKIVEVAVSNRHPYSPTYRYQVYQSNYYRRDFIYNMSVATETSKEGVRYCVTATYNHWATYDNWQGFGDWWYTLYPTNTNEGYYLDLAFPFYVPYKWQTQWSDVIPRKVGEKFKLQFEQIHTDWSHKYDEDGVLIKPAYYFENQWFQDVDLGEIEIEVLEL
jgi:hypothetical protein